MMRPIKSYVTRKGRFTKLQKTSMEQHWSRYGLDKNIKPTWNKDSSILEIGFGMGNTLIQDCQNNHRAHFVGIETYVCGIGNILHQAHTKNIQNLQIYHGDAIEILHSCIANASLDKIQIFFPDPWPKSKHHKRRIINPDNLTLFSKKIKPKGTLHIATDWAEYTTSIKNLLGISSVFNIQKDFVHNRTETKFEKRGKILGHNIFDVIAQRV